MNHNYKYVLIREYTYPIYGTFGKLYLYDGQKRVKFLSDTLEPPFDSYRIIPAGIYTIETTYSPKFKTFLPLLFDVPGRIGIRIHAGNTCKDTDGCILVGKRKEFMLVNSRDTLFNIVIPDMSWFAVKKFDVRNCVTLDMFSD